jgi:hypothetical protein
VGGSVTFETKKHTHKKEPFHHISRIEFNA